MAVEDILKYSTPYAIYQAGNWLFTGDEPEGGFVGGSVDFFNAPLETVEDGVEKVLVWASRAGVVIGTYLTDAFQRFGIFNRISGFILGALDVANDTGIASIIFAVLLIVGTALGIFGKLFKGNI